MLYLSNHVLAVVNFPSHRTTNTSDGKREIENWIISMSLIDSLVIVSNIPLDLAEMLVVSSTHTLLLGCFSPQKA